MKLGLVIVTYNRPHYLKECLDSLRRADLSLFSIIHFEDAGSTDKSVIDQIIQFQRERGVTENPFFTTSQRRRITECLLHGWDYLVNQGCDVLMNLDSDAIVRNDFSEQIKNHLLKFEQNQIVTGFNCLTKNKDGSERHIIEDSGEGWNRKKSVGGINMCFSLNAYAYHIRPALIKTKDVGNWDHEACKSVGGAYCTVPSVIQHIGIDSAMGHAENPDTAEDFKPLHLPNVTLIGVDNNRERLQSAFNECQKSIIFGASKLINADIRSKEQYSNYVIRELYKHVDTEFMLIVQWDGYVINWKAWDNNWLNYDYIGAPWEWYTDGRQVGNGGFSLRSRRLMEICATDVNIHRICHPEDDVICRQRGNYLVQQYGIKFAPVQVARKFSIEGYRSPNQRHTNEFGFHGTTVMKNLAPQNGAGKIVIIEQFFGIGDVIFCVQIARTLIKQGYKVLWPVQKEYVEQLNLAYPDILFMDVHQSATNFNNKEDVTIGSYRLIPLRWTYEILRKPLQECMSSKYDYMGLDWRTWREAKFERNHEKELELFNKLGLKKGEKYCVINRNFTSTRGKTSAFNPPATDLKTVHMDFVEGFGLFDWAYVLGNASEIHTVSTSIIYILELINLQCEPHIYIRRPNEADHSYYSYILEKHKYKLMP